MNYTILNMHRQENAGINEQTKKYYVLKSGKWSVANMEHEIFSTNFSLSFE